MESTLPTPVAKTCRVTSVNLELDDILLLLTEKYPNRKIIRRKENEGTLDISSSEIVVSGDEEYDNLVSQLKRKEEELKKLAENRESAFASCVTQPPREPPQPE